MRISPSAHVAVVAFVLIAGLLNSSTHAADAPPPLRLSPVIIKDPMINNNEAVRFLAPAGWKVEGGVVWHMETWLMTSLNLRLSDPASKAAIAIHPGDTFTYSQGALFAVQGNPRGRYMGSLVMQLPDRVTDTITRLIVPAYEPQLGSATIVDAKDLPDLAAVILAQNQEQGLEKTCQAARVRFAYKDADGTALEQDVYAVVIRTPMPAIGAMSWHLERAFSVRAAKGHLDEMTPILTTMMTSSRLGRDWVAGYQYVIQLRNQGTMQAIADAGALSRHIAQNAEEMRQANQAAFENQQKVEDRTSRAFSQSLRGVEDYNAPAGGRVELPTGYEHAWYDQTAGEYVLSSDPNFDPTRGSTHNWTPVQRAGN